MKNVYIIGVDTMKFGKHPDMTIPQMTTETVERCLKDAGVEKKDIESVHFGNCDWGYFDGQYGIRGQVALRDCGLQEIAITNVEGACATGSIALNEAWKDILSGLYDCTMAIGVEKLYTPDKEKAFGAFNVGLDVSQIAETMEAWEDFASKITFKVPENANPVGHSPFMDIYAYGALSHMGDYGTTQRQYAIIAAKNHNNGCLNPNAQYQFPMTVDDVLKDYVVSWPLTRSMCSPIGDGAASAILCSEEYLRKLPESVQKRAVLIKASVLVSGKDDDPKLPNNERSGHCSVRAAKAAYKMADLTPADMDVAEVHDAAAPSELVQYENLGFCPQGKGGEFAESGATQIGGKIAVNCSGGLESRGHPIGASGLAMTHEIVTQLRGEAGKRQQPHAKTGIIENGGGNIGLGEAACVVTILQKP